MAKEWKQHISNLDYIISNTRVGFNLTADCRTELDHLNHQLKLVQSLDNDARFPSNKEIARLNSLYTRYVTEMQIEPRTYYMPPIEKKLDIDLSSLTDVKTIKIHCNLIKRKLGKGLMVYLYIVDKDGNWSRLKEVPVGKTPVVTLYEGIKFCDKFIIGFSDPKINKEDVKVTVSFTEES